MDALAKYSSHNPYNQYVSILHCIVTILTTSMSVSYTVQSQSLQPVCQYLTLYSHNPYNKYVSITHCTVTVPQSYIITDATLKFFTLAHVKGHSMFTIT